MTEDQRQERLELSRKLEERVSCPIISKHLKQSYEKASVFCHWNFRALYVLHALIEYKIEQLTNFSLRILGQLSAARSQFKTPTTTNSNRFTTSTNKWTTKWWRMDFNSIIETMTCSCGRKSVFNVSVNVTTTICGFDLKFFDCFKLAARSKILINLLFHKEQPSECLFDCPKIFNKTSEWLQNQLFENFMETAMENMP